MSGVHPGWKGGEKKPFSCVWCFIIVMTDRERHDEFFVCMLREINAQLATFLTLLSSRHAYAL